MSKYVYHNVSSPSLSIEGTLKRLPEHENFKGDFKSKSKLLFRSPPRFPPTFYPTNEFKYPTNTQSMSNNTSFVSSPCLRPNFSPCLNSPTSPLKSSSQNPLPIAFFHKHLKKISKNISPSFSSPLFFSPSKECSNVPFSGNDVPKINALPTDTRYTFPNDCISTGLFLSFIRSSFLFLLFPRLHILSESNLCMTSVFSSRAYKAAQYGECVLLLQSIKSSRGWLGFLSKVFLNSSLCVFFCFTSRFLLYFFFFSYGKIRNTTSDVVLLRCNHKICNACLKSSICHQCLDQQLCPIWKPKFFYIPSPISAPFPPFFPTSLSLLFFDCFVLFLTPVSPRCSQSISNPRK